MISKRIACSPSNDNYRRLAAYIAAGREQEKEHVRHYQPYPGRFGNLAENRVRRLSECRLASYSQGEERGIANFLSADARLDRHADRGMRWNADLSISKDVGTEKCLMKWCEGCWAGDDYELAVREVADTQALNTRTTKEKTYHLIVSFRPEDGPKLTPEAFREIERRFAAALGLSEHQRHCGVHVNTDNMHMHVAYNLIHPERLIRVEPYRDYLKRDKLCRELEKEYGLVIDNGREKGRDERLGERAATVEAHSGRQSFEGYAQEQSKAILAKMENAGTWEDVHAAFAMHGLELKRRGAGLVVKNRHGRETAKASAVNREFSLKKLQERFGKFSPNLPASEVRFGTKATQKAPNREATPITVGAGSQSFEGYAQEQGKAILTKLENAGTWEDVHAAFAAHGLELKRRGAELVVRNRYGREMVNADTVSHEISLKRLQERFGEFSPSLPVSEVRFGAKPLQKAPNRESLWEEFQEQSLLQKNSLERIRKKWAEKRKELESRPIARRTRANLIRLTRQYEAEELHAVRMKHLGVGNWVDFLRQKAARGDENALAVLRSRHEEFAPEQLEEEREKMRARADLLARKTAIAEKSGLSRTTKASLSSMALMESLVPEASARISRHGVIIFTMPDGGKICDTGRAISYSDNAREQALAYMAEKWNVRRKDMDRKTGRTVYTLASGQRVEDRGNVIERPAFRPQRERARGMER